MPTGVVFELGGLEYEITHDPPSDPTTKAIMPLVAGTRVPLGYLRLGDGGTWTRELTPGAAEEAFRLIADVADGRVSVGMAGATVAAASSATAPCARCSRPVSVRPRPGSRAARCPDGHWNILDVKAAPAGAPVDDSAEAIQRE